jgi:hypothetical protein
MAAQGPWDIEKKPQTALSLHSFTSQLSMAFVGAHVHFKPTLGHDGDCQWVKICEEHGGDDGRQTPRGSSQLQYPPGKGPRVHE